MSAENNQGQKGSIAEGTRPNCETSNCGTCYSRYCHNSAELTMVDAVLNSMLLDEEIANRHLFNFIAI